MFLQNMRTLPLLKQKAFQWKAFCVYGGYILWYNGEKWEVLLWKFVWQNLRIL